MAASEETSSTVNDMSFWRNGVDLRPVMILIFFFSFLLGLLFLGGINIINKSFFKLPEYKDPAEEAHKLVDVRFDESINLADWVYKFGAIQCPTKVNSTIDLVIEELNLNVAMAILDPIENFDDLKLCIQRLRPFIDNCLDDHSKAVNMLSFKQRIFEIKAQKTW